MDDLIQEIYADLETELSIVDSNFNSTLLYNKVSNAAKEVKQARHFPSDYTDDMILEDMECYYSTIRDVALFDYNAVGAEFQTSSSENSVQRVWVSRDSLFSGIIPLSR